MKWFNSERREWALILLTLLVGICLLQCISLQAINVLTRWQAETNMYSALDPNQDYEAQWRVVVEPVRDEIMTPVWDVDLILTPQSDSGDIVPPVSFKLPTPTPVPQPTGGGESSPTPGTTDTGPGATPDIHHPTLTPVAPLTGTPSPVVSTTGVASTGTPTLDPSRTSTQSSTTPTPSRTVEATPTATTAPSQTPIVTVTPGPSNTPRSTKTDKPSNTPKRTDPPTDTPAPTDTPQPTNTDKPTKPPKDTDTPAPVATIIEPSPEPTSTTAVVLPVETPQLTSQPTLSGAGITRAAGRFLIRRPGAAHLPSGAGRLLMPQSRQPFLRAFTGVR